MEVRHLQAVDAIAATGSISAAALRLGCTQSAVSQRVQALERELGTPILIRRGGSRPVILTKAGRSVAEHASTILARLELIKHVATEAGTARTTLRVGTVGSTAHHILPQAMALMRQRWSGINIQLREEHGDTPLLAALERGQLDATFAHLPLPGGPFKSEHLITVSQVLIAAKSQDLGGGDGRAMLTAACQLPYIAFKQVRPPHDAVRQLRALGLDPQVILWTDDNRTLQRLVGAGIGVAVVPETAIDPSDTGIQIVRDIADVPPFPFGVAWHADVQPPTDFIRCASVAAKQAAARLASRNGSSGT
jgi:DNA-binding transcriptional LysR family regulator